jgi:DNA-binding response OmpR family regulator
MDYPWLELAISIGADEVLVKPYCPEQLLNRIAASIFEVQKKGARLFAPGQQTDRNLLLHSAAF